MWHPWSKTSTLAVCSSGVAISLHGQKPQLLTDATFVWKDASQLTEIIENNKNLFKNQRVNVILSNTFVRYIVLPWQDNVFKQADWQAIAQHEFRKQFGTVVSDWLVSVSLAKHGQALLAAAIDNSLYAQLQSSAEQNGFNLCAIEPLLMRIFNQQNPNTWALVAEPQRLLLCHTHDDEWQQVVVDSPPAGQEYQKAEQLIQRCLLQLDTSVRPNKVDTYVSPVLNKIWQDNIGSRQKLMTHLSAIQPHAVWMAELPWPNNKTQRLKLDFADKTHANTTLGDLILLLGAISLTAFLWASYLQAQTKINLLQLQAELPLEAYSNTKLDPVHADNLKLAQQSQQQLNLPWMPMLAALEAVKKTNPSIQLLNINPNKNRAEIKLSGEAATFADVTHFIDDLRANPAFSDAVLVGQHLEQDVDKPKSSLVYVFEVNLGWRV